MKLEHSTYQKPLSLTGFGGGATSLSFSSSGSSIVQDGLNQWFDFGDSNCYTHPASNLTGYDPTYVADLSGNNNDARLFFYRGGSSGTWGVNFDSSNGGHLDIPNTLSYSGQTNNFPILFRNTDVFDNVGNGDYALEFWFNVNHNGNNTALYVDKNCGYDMQRSFGSGNNSRMEDYYIDQFMTENNGPQWSYGLNGWYHYVWSVTGRGTNAVKAYWNGVNTDSYTPSITSRWNYSSSYGNSDSGVFAGPGNSTASYGPWTGVVMLAANNTQTQRYTGKFAIHRMYRNYSLTQADVTQHFEAERSRFGV